MLQPLSPQLIRSLKNQSHHVVYHSTHQLFSMKHIIFLVFALLVCLVHALPLSADGPLNTLMRKLFGNDDKNEAETVTPATQSPALETPGEKNLLAVIPDTTTSVFNEQENSQQGGNNKRKPIMNRRKERRRKKKQLNSQLPSTPDIEPTEPKLIDGSAELGQLSADNTDEDSSDNSSIGIVIAFSSIALVILAVGGTVMHSRSKRRRLEGSFYVKPVKSTTQIAPPPVITVTPMPEIVFDRGSITRTPTQMLSEPTEAFRPYSIEENTLNRLVQGISDSA
jgi:hypothetical protein